MNQQKPPNQGYNRISISSPSLSPPLSPPLSPSVSSSTCDIRFKSVLWMMVFIISTTTSSSIMTPSLFVHAFSFTASSKQSHSFPTASRTNNKVLLFIPPSRSSESVGGDEGSCNTRTLLYSTRSASSSEAVSSSIPSSILQPRKKRRSISSTKNDHSSNSGSAYNTSSDNNQILSEEDKDETNNDHQFTNGQEMKGEVEVEDNCNFDDSHDDHGVGDEEDIKENKKVQVPYEQPPTAASTLDGRLLCASQCSYDIQSPYFLGASYRPATTAKRLTKGVNSILIGHTYDGITIAFRGTQSSSPLDWLQNAALFLSNVDTIKGKIHTGFYRGTKKFWNPLRNIIKEMLEESRENGWKEDVILTGHSKGGAMATVAATLMKRDGDLPDPTYVCTFASAKVGDSEFCLEYNKQIKQTSYEAHLDIIPFLPPSSSTMDTMDDSMTDMLDSMLWSGTSIQKKESYKWDYQTVGTRKFVTQNFDIVDEVTRELDEERIKTIEKSTFLSVGEFKSAHCSSCPGEGCNGYYFNAIAKNICDLYTATAITNTETTSITQEREALGNAL